MDLAQLLARLVPLLGDARANGGKILALLERAAPVAESEVARHLVMKRTEALVRELLASADPRERRRAIAWVERTWSRAPATQVIRAATKDRSSAVRRAAFRATHTLRIDDVALPDTSTTFRAARLARRSRTGINPFTKQPLTILGPDPAADARGFDPTGWRYGLYPPYGRSRRSELAHLVTRADVERLLGVAPRDLDALLRPGAGRGAPYVAFEIPKARGGTRLLHAPRAPLKRLQRALLDRVLAPLPVHDAAHGFVPGRSTVTNAAAHRGARLLFKTDVVDFFPSIHFFRLVGLFEHYGAGREAARTLAALVTHRHVLPDGRVAWPSVLPQGAPTSPVLSNLVCRRLDARLGALAAKVGGRYTRYADDLTFSFVDEPQAGLGRFAWWVDQVLGQEGFVENVAKRRVLRPTSAMRVTGIVTNAGLTVPREARRRFRAILHDCAQRGVTAEVVGHDEPRAYLLGFAAYVAMVQPALGAKLRAEVRNLLARP